MCLGRTAIKKGDEECVREAAANRPASPFVSHCHRFVRSLAASNILQANTALGSLAPFSTQSRAVGIDFDLKGESWSAVQSDFAHGHFGVHFACREPVCKMGGADEPCSSSMVKRGDGKRRRRQTKHYNRRKCYLKLPSASVRPRPNVKPNGDDQYVVEKILAVFATGDRRAYYLDWHGSPKKESWVLSEDCDCAEYVAHFTAVTTAEGVLDCLLGQSVPQHIFELLQNNVKFTHVREMLGTSVAPTSEVNLSFAPDIEERQKAKALRTLASFIAECMDA
ncbi:hypothetical protein GPALN_012312 [Globodera pallida]|nr:hypothetical protein GPALN_012312 [Globodera pallida]